MNVLLVVILAATAVTRGWLGFGFTPYRTEKENWLQVRRLERGGPAERAGLRIHDVVTAIDGRPVSFKSDIDAVQFFHAIRARQTMRLHIRRGTESRIIVIVAETLPESAALKRRGNVERANAHASN